VGSLIDSHAGISSSLGVLPYSPMCTRTRWLTDLNRELKSTKTVAGDVWHAGNQNLGSRRLSIASSHGYVGIGGGRGLLELLQTCACSALVGYGL
jgi:hypothetical protein